MAGGNLVRGGVESLCAIQAAMTGARLEPVEAVAWDKVKDVMRSIVWAPWRYRQVYNQDLFKQFRALRSVQWACGGLGVSCVS